MLPSAPRNFRVGWLLPVGAYCSASILMTLTNKLVLSGFEYKLPFLLLAVQAVGSVVLLEMSTLVGWTPSHRALNRTDVRRWLPVAVLMGAMLYSGSKALQFLPIAVFTVFKNLAIVVVAYGEAVLFATPVSSLMLLSFLLMLLSSLISAHADLASASTTSMAGYAWMGANCVASAAYVLYMRYSIKNAPSGSRPFKDWDTVFYNNILTAPLFLFLSLSGADGHLSDAFHHYALPEHAHERTRIIGAFLFSGISAFWISYASAWCIRVTNSTTYSMVGALNKLPIAVSGMMVFHDVPITLGSVSGIMLGFGSGLVYTYAKLKEPTKNNQSTSSSSSSSDQSSDQSSIPLYTPRQGDK